MTAPRTLRLDEVAPGDELPELRVPITATLVIAGAIFGYYLWDLRDDAEGR